MDPITHAVVSLAGTLLAARVVGLWRLALLRRRTYPLPRG